MIDDSIQKYKFPNFRTVQHIAEKQKEQTRKKKIREKDETKIPNHCNKMRKPQWLCSTIYRTETVEILLQQVLKSMVESASRLGQTQGILRDCLSALREGHHGVWGQLQKILQS